MLWRRRTYFSQIVSPPASPPDNEAVGDGRVQNDAPRAARSRYDSQDMRGRWRARGRRFAAASFGPGTGGTQAGVTRL